jgi:hypothetical protein
VPEEEPMMLALEDRAEADARGDNAPYTKTELGCDKRLNHSSSEEWW